MNDVNHVVPRCWLVEPLADDVKSSLARLARAEDVRHIAVMPDVHLAAEVCVGVVLATTRLIYPQAVGGDIGCGMAALRFNASANALAEAHAAARLLAGLYRCVPTNRHSKATLADELPDELRAAPLSTPKLEKLKQREGRVQLGTLGRGNHFLEFQADEDDRLWVMVHSGSRAMGQAIAAQHACASRLTALDAATPAGEAYLADAAWARRYAAGNRLAMLAAVEKLLAEQFGIQADADSLIHADHNHVAREQHFGQQYFVHRKGAQSAAPGEPGIIPGSIGTASFHTIGRG
jgi:tRNA-splicing ligase RtcB